MNAYLSEEQGLLDFVNTALKKNREIAQARDYQSLPRLTRAVVPFWTKFLLSSTEA